MVLPKILVSGATGKTGTQVVHQLREKGFPVRAMVHKSDDRSEQLRSIGAEIVVADLYDYDQVLAAMDGIKRTYFCPPVQPFMIQAAVTFAVAAQAAKIEFIAQLSQWLASPAHPSMHTRQLWLVEKIFATLPGIRHTVINPGFFAEPLLGFIPGAVNLGVFPNPAGAMINPSPSNEDIARVVVAVLADPDRHAGKRYRPTSARSVSVTDIADLIGDAVGRNVKVQELTPKMFLKAGPATGVSGFEITNVRHYFEDGKRGTFGINGPTKGIRELTGQEPEDMKTIVRRYASRPNARRSLGAAWREIRTMIRIILTPAFDADAFDREQGYPIPPNPRLSADCEIWHREHDHQEGPTMRQALNRVGSA